MVSQARLDRDLKERRFQLLVDAVTDYAIYMLDPTGHVATWNSGARRFKGYTADEIIGRHFSRFFTEEDRRAGLPEHILRTAADEGRFEMEGWRVRKDGARFWASVVVDPIRDKSGALLGFTKITRDITERTEAERNLFESEQRFRMLVQGVRDYAIYMLDAEGYISNWNPGAEAIKGYSEAEIVGQHFSRFYTEQDQANGEPTRALATALSEGKYEKEAWRVRKSGERFWASVLIDPIYDQQGRLSGFAKVTRDITEKKRAEEELEKARTALFQAQKLQALGELTGGIAHDFNNLITVIRGSAEMLQKQGLPEEKRDRYVQAIADTADRATALTGHLLAFGRRQALKPEVLDLNVRLDAFAEMVARTLGSRIIIELDLAPSLWLVEVDPNQLESALLNAAINARDAMPHGGRLVLTTRNMDESDEVRISIADNGGGMSAKVRERAFEPFFTTKEVGKGTGLGLSQIHGFAAQTGGRCEIDSKQGEGTALHLFLPRTTKRMTPAEKGAIDNVDLSGKTVLLVEDNELVRRFAESLLTELGCQVISAASGDEALRLLDGKRMDFVFSDIVMPGISGIELADAIAQRQPDLPVLLATGYSRDLAARASDFRIVAKPYGARALSEAITELLTVPKRAKDREGKGPAMAERA